MTNFVDLTPGTVTALATDTGYVSKGRSCMIQFNVLYAGIYSTVVCELFSSNPIQ